MVCESIILRIYTLRFDLIARLSRQDERTAEEEADLNRQDDEDHPGSADWSSAERSA